MAIKFILFAAVVAVARAGLIGAPALAYSHGGPALGYARAAPLAYAAPAQYAHAAPLAYAAPAQYAHAVDTEFDPHPKYSYGYDIQDALTGDSKSQHEERDGDVVRGYYSLVDADGTKRTVEYTADDHNGFNAVVHKEPLVQKVAVAKVAAPLAYAAPVAKYAAPALAYSHGPALGYAHAGPALGYAHAAPALAYSHGGPALAYNAYH